MAALFVGVGPAKAWEDVPGNERADGCVGRMEPSGGQRGPCRISPSVLPAPIIFLVMEK